MGTQEKSEAVRKAKLVEDGALPIAEAVQFSGVTRAELYKRMKRGELPYVKLGKRRLIARNALRAMLATGVVMAEG